MIVIEVVFDARREARDDFIDLARRTMEASRREAGCVLYRFAADLELANRFTLTEVWESEQDLKAHFRGSAFKAFFAELPQAGEFVSYSAWDGPLADYVPPRPEE
jgi:quinol monooxygenase YgiN